MKIVKQHIVAVNMLKCTDAILSGNNKHLQIFDEVSLPASYMAHMTKMLRKRGFTKSTRGLWELSLI